MANLDFGKRSEAVRQVSDETIELDRIWPCRDGRRRLPFFTSNDYVQTFVGEYSKERNRVNPVQLLGVKGSFLAHVLPACDVLVMNDRSADEVELSDAGAVAIRRMWG